MSLATEGFSAMMRLFDMLCAFIGSVHASAIAITATTWGAHDRRGALAEASNKFSLRLA